MNEETVDSDFLWHRVRGLFIPLISDFRGRAENTVDEFLGFGSGTRGSGLLILVTDP